MLYPTVSVTDSSKEASFRPAPVQCPSTWTARRVRRRPRGQDNLRLPADRAGASGSGWLVQKATTAYRRARSAGSAF